MRKRFSNVTQRQAVSMVSLNPREETGSNTKLEPIITRHQNNQGNSTLESILKSPTESIKARLSSAEQRDFNRVNASLERLNLKQDEENEPEDDTNKKADRMVIGDKEKKKKINEDEVLGDYYREVVTSVHRCNSTIDAHKATLEHAKDESDELMKKLQETDRMTAQLKHTSFITDTAENVVQEILKEEYIFQRQNNKKSTAEEFLVKVMDSNGNEARKEPKVTLEEKRKLLEALRAIDNGEAVDVPITDTTSRKSKLMKELFGNTDH